MLANKAFGFSPEYTLWGVDAQTLGGMFTENYYMNKKPKYEKDAKGEFEWIEMEDIDGKVKKVKKYIDPENLI